MMLFYCSSMEIIFTFLCRSWWTIASWWGCHHLRLLSRKTSLRIIVRTVFLYSYFDGVFHSFFCAFSRRLSCPGNHLCFYRFRGRSVWLISAFTVLCLFCWVCFCSWSRVDVVWVSTLCGCNFPYSALCSILNIFFWIGISDIKS